jgi:four helix bundle protein
MDEREFKRRTREFGLRAIRLVVALPRGPVEEVLGKQLLRSATSVGSNYRAACRAKSRADMIAKLSIVEEEADESVHWLEMLVDSKCVSAKKACALIDEGNEIVAMLVTSLKTLRREPNPKSKI